MHRLIPVPILLVSLSGACSHNPGEVIVPPIVQSRAIPPRQQPHASAELAATPARTPWRLAQPAEKGWFPNGRKISSRWTWIVIHHSATARGGAACFDRAHQKNGWDELGYHFVIGNGTDTPDGQIEVGSRWHKQKHGAHCKTPGNYFNNHGIGICLVGDFEETNPTARQLEALDRLLRFLTAACDIPPSRIATHGEVTHKTLCPGRKLPIRAIRRSAQAS